MTRTGAILEATASSSPESRVLVAYSPSFSASSGTSQGSIFHLKSPKTGSKSCYMILNGMLQEIHWFKQPFSSWFLGNYIIEDGSLYMCTLVDPLFILLPILDEVRMKKEGDMGKFRALEEILYVEGCPGYCFLQPLLQHTINAVCEVRDVGNSRYYRLEDSKVLSWLCCKVLRTLEGLHCIKGYESMSEETKKICAVGLIGDYIKEDPWLKMLCNHLSVELPRSKKTQDMDTCEMLLLSESKACMDKKEDKVFVAKSKLLKKGSVTGMRKVTQFFAVER